MDQTAEQQIHQKLNSVSSNKSTSGFVAGNIKNFIENWKEIRSDSIILDIVENGLKIEFLNIPGNLKVPQIPHCVSEQEIITTEIKSLLRKGVIVESSRESGYFISTVFTRKKKSGTVRFILNLKYLDNFVMYKHFKMESILGVFKIIKKDVWMTSVDLKDAFFAIPINEACQKYFMFEWLEKNYKFIAMPNGFSDAMPIFTKVSKPVYAYLRQQVYMSVIFVDDSYLQGDTKQECLQNIEPTVSLLESLGSAIHEGKSILNLT